MAASEINATTGGLVSTAGADAELVLKTNSTAAISIDGSQNVTVAGTLSAGGDTVVTLDGTQTLTNKTISGASNTLTVDGTDAVGFRNTPVNEKSTDYTLVLSDSGKTIFHPAADTNDRDFTIPAESSVNYAIGTVVTFVNLSANDLEILITTDTMYLAGDGTTGTRTLAQYGVASAVKVASTTWIISGNGLT